MALRYPLDNFTITQGFGGNADYYRQFGQQGHNGIDMGAAAGTPVYAAEAGVVSFEGWGQNSSWMGGVAGICIIIRHSDCHTGYAHLTSTVINKNQSVSKGQLIGYVGATGTATGPHLHFEVFPLSPNFSNGFAGRVNPAPYISTVKTATEAEIKQAYWDILEREADAGGIKTYLAFPIDFVRQDLANSQEKRNLDARKAEAARLAAVAAAAQAALDAENARKAAEAKAAEAAAKKAEEDRLAAEAELARVSEEERIAREAAEARAQVQADIAKKAKEDAMATAAEVEAKTQALVDEVAKSDVVQDLVAGVSKRTKLIVYFIGDSLLGAALVAPQVTGLVEAISTGNWTLIGVFASSILGTLGGYILTMFGIYKSNAK